jgi:hypothetical protein
MEQAYWLRRTRASSEMARRARTAEARMAHLELAGRYSIKAATASPRPAAAARLELRPAMGEAEVDAVFGGAAYYERLEAGARWMATQAATAAERDGHIEAANRYARLRSDAASSTRVFA